MELKKLDMDDIKRRILYGLIILSLLPLITMFYINLKQDKWETDRNFYGKESSEDQLKKQSGQSIFFQIMASW